MVTRRAFLKAISAAGAAVTLAPSDLLTRHSRTTADGFCIHPFIENNPQAVFIMRTSVDVKTNAAAKKQAGLDFARSIFLPLSTEEGGFPLTEKIVIKPNLTCRDRSNPKYTIEGTMGIVTDADFVEGVIDGMKERGLPGSGFYIREVNCPADFGDGGYMALASRTGADLRDLSAPIGSISGDDVVWLDVPDGVWFTRIPYLWPVNAPETLLLNIAKLKAHGMGITLTAKNLQGAIAHNYQAHCRAYGSAMSIAPEHMRTDANATILANYNRHVADGIPRWDRPGSTGGLWQETWASRCLDNNSVTHAQLHIIEGIYGRDGNFVVGPSPEGLATDYMTNMIIFGKNPFLVDNIGHWLAGHEPGNFGLFHLARERGMTSRINPANIPLYEWFPGGTATPSPLSGFARTPLLTYYLRRDYSGMTEPYWHLCAEPYAYGPESVESAPAMPELFILSQNYPNPFNASTSIQYAIPRGGTVLLEVFNVYGERLDVLVNSRREMGRHMVIWNSNRAASGAYFLRMTFGGYSKSTKMMLLR
jgi:uncharacterized protein (DUF362 family)